MHFTWEFARYARDTAAFASPSFAAFYITQNPFHAKGAKINAERPQKNENLPFIRIPDVVRRQPCTIFLALEYVDIFC